MPDWIHELAAFTDDDARSLWISLHPQFRSVECLEQLHSAVIAHVHSDLDAAARLATGASLLTESDPAADPVARALAIRSSGHVHYARAEYSQALAAYTMAVALFDSSGRELDVARTLSGALQSLIYLGEHDRALEWAARAGDIFRHHGDELRLARLTSNMGNILYRQDRHAKAMDYYIDALATFRRIGQPSDVAAALSNIAVCSTSLGRFPEALATYNEVRAHCQTHNLPLLRAAADYNIAYLHYLRSEYLLAIDLYAKTRTHCEQVGDAYHAALCDLDESEMYLELNLSAEGGELARRAAIAFDKLKMGYERAKALVNEGVAESHTGNARSAIRLFRSARALFVEQQNEIWPALIDLYQAILAHRLGDPQRARRLCRRAYQVLRHSLLPGKATLCELLEAQLRLESGDTGGARFICASALERLERTGVPSQRYQAWFVLGQIDEASGLKDEALTSYRRAQEEIESLRSRLWGENSRISFLKDKLAVYESLVTLYLDPTINPESESPSPLATHHSSLVTRHSPLNTTHSPIATRHSPLALPRHAAAFLCIEHAKSRSMAEMLTVPEMPVPELEEIRRDLNWHYRQIELAALLKRSGLANQIELFQRRAREREDEIARRFTALRPSDLGPYAPPMPVDQIRAAIPADATLVEFYEARGVFYACLLNRELLEILPVAPSSEVQTALRLFQFQIAKFRLGADHLERFAIPFRAAAEAHLGRLYKLLVEPFRHRLANTRHLIIVPHGFLHSLPFHALYDGTRFLIDDFTISYAPSAGVFALCSGRPSQANRHSLVLGVPDPLAPEIEQEAHSVAAAIPGSRLFIGENATEDNLHLHGPGSRFLHIATHGLFRRDNPLFSSIRLGDCHLSLLDLYQIPLAAELVTLSGCSTGLNAVVGGDELLGLVRGLLYAGARSALVSLWDVNDSSTTEFMTTVYPAVLASGDKAAALRTAMLRIRDHYPHPYHWAPFVLVGNRN